jgi:RNA polymerase sigma-70 factor (ECF subfamily)
LRRSSSTGGERFVRFSTTIYEGTPARFQDGGKKIKIAAFETSSVPHSTNFGKLRGVDLAPPVAPLVIALPSGERRRMFMRASRVATMATNRSSQKSGQQRLESLMRDVARRDQAAFRALYDATRAKLYGVILGILGERSAADDLLQEIYVKIWDRAADYDPGKASPITWMATIARNRALDEVRRPRLAIDLPDEALERIAGDEPDPLERRRGSEELRRLMACLAALAEDRRQMVLLAYYRGWTREALSKRFDRPVPTIKTLLHRSLAQLRGCLGDG